MGANTVQEMFEKLWNMWVFGIWPLVLDGKRSVQDLLDFFQMMKFRREEFDLHVGVLRGTHRIVEIEKPQPKPTDPLAEFFTTRSGLYVLGEFTDWILAPALAMDEIDPARVGTSFDLPKNMADAEIRKEIGENHVFENARAFCLYLKDALERQWDGVEGNLLNNGYANIFFVRGLNSEVFAVLVGWSADDQEWRVRAHRLGARQWLAGLRAFPRAA